MLANTPTARLIERCKRNAWEANVPTDEWQRCHSRLILALALGAAIPAQACWNDAATRYQVDSTLLYAIARTESGLNPLAIGRNRNGSRDIGLMQINSAWLSTLATYGISERDLLDPCTNIHVGAWILSYNFYRLGYTWDAVGAYNAVNPRSRRAYIDKVRRNLRTCAVSAQRSGCCPLALSASRCTPIRKIDHDRLLAPIEDRIHFASENRRNTLDTFRGGTKQNLDHRNLSLRSQ